VDRASRLGDIFHSNPLVVGRPRSFINESSYRAFRDTYATRDNMIFAGSNGGFLHGFHAGDWQANPIPVAPPGYDRGTGEEIFGFMPWPVRQNARYLPIDTGTRSYYGVDGSPAAADVWIHSTPTQTAKAADGSEWRTVLAGGLRQGGRAYYALDVSDPSAGNYPGYLWEFPREDAPVADRAFVGETWGEPVMTKVQVEIGGQPYERWVAIVSGGYDRRSDPNDALNYDANVTAGRAIYILDMKTGQVLGEKKFTPAATDGRQDMLYAMPSTPSVFDSDLDGYADVIYMGDLGGNVWKWIIKYDPFFGNFLTDPINSTGVVSQPDTKFRKFFEAKATPASSLGVTVSGTTYYKSIFYSPSGAFSLNRFWLAFGTGERTDLQRTHDASTTAENNRFYSVKDEDIFDRRATIIPTRTEQDLLDTSTSATCPNLASQSGFFFRVDDDEKFVTDTTIFSYWVIAASFTPSGVVDPCSSSGDARLYVFKVHCGQGFFFNSASATSADLAGSGPGGSGGATDPALADFGDPASRYLDLGAGLPTDPRVTVGPGGAGGSSGSRVFVTQQDGVINNLDAPDDDTSAPGQLYWREVTGEFAP
jgi:Tfp pilus tip-associated adhesin PilY1